MNYFVVATHSNLANGYQDIINFFLPGRENIFYINAYVKSNDFESELLHIITSLKGKNIIVLTDIKGGSVNQVSAKFINEYSLHLISGLNLPLLLELLTYPSLITKNEIDKFIFDARNEIVYINDLLK